MVRAAAAGVIDYTRADPKDINWRLRHQLLLTEVQRQEMCRLKEATQRDALAYVSHGRLEPQSFKAFTEYSNALLEDIRRAIFPWLNATSTENEDQKDTIDNETAALIEKYKARFGEQKK